MVHSMHKEKKTKEKKRKKKEVKRPFKLKRGREKQEKKRATDQKMQTSGEQYIRGKGGGGKKKVTRLE